jgi:hypothetical protein
MGGGGGGGQRPIWFVNEPKKVGTCSARARTRSQKLIIKLQKNRQEEKKMKSIQIFVNLHFLFSDWA